MLSTAAGTLLLCFSCVLMAHGQVITTQVIIGGAGYSGISLGQELSKHEFGNFSILEASDRVGGRIRKVQMGDYFIDDGAAMVHGTNLQPSWIDGVQKYPVAHGVVDYGSMAFFDQEGHSFRYNSACQTFSKAFGTAYNFITRCMHPRKLKRKRRRKCRKTVRDFGTKKFQGDSLSFAELLREIDGWDYRNQKNVAVARLCELTDIDWEFGQSSETLSANNSYPFPRQDEVSNKELLIADKRGYEWVVKSLGAEYLSTNRKDAEEIQFDDARLSLQTKITRVQWDPSGTGNVTVEACPTIRIPKTYQSPDRFPCRQDGLADRIFVGKEFVSTFSVGVLQRSIEEELRGATVEESRNIAPRFDPPLSMFPDLANSILQFAYTDVARVFLQFREKFWPSVQFFGTAYSSGPFVGNFAPIWYNYDVPGVYLGSRIIMVMIVGDRFWDFTELSRDEARDQLLRVLESMFPVGIRSALGRSNLRPSDVREFHSTRWTEDPLYRGAWSSFQVGQPESEARLLGGSGHGNLFFSGEATCRRHAGTTGGAVEGGKRTARFLLKERYERSVSTRTACDFKGRRADE